MFGSRKPKTVHKGHLCLPLLLPGNSRKESALRRNVKPLLLKAKPIYSPEPQRAGTEEREVERERSPQSSTGRQFSLRWQVNRTSRCPLGWKADAASEAVMITVATGGQPHTSSTPPAPPHQPPPPVPGPAQAERLDGGRGGGNHEAAGQDGGPQAAESIFVLGSAKHILRAGVRRPGLPSDVAAGSQGASGQSYPFGAPVPLPARQGG